jgi:hypothetical protein
MRKQTQFVPHCASASSHYEVDGILVAARDRRDPRHHHLEHLVTDAARIPAIRHRISKPPANPELALRLPQQQQGLRGLIAAVKIHCELLAPDKWQVEGKWRRRARWSRSARPAIPPTLSACSRSISTRSRQGRGQGRAWRPTISSQAFIHRRPRRAHPARAYRQFAQGAAGLPFADRRDRRHRQCEPHLHRRQASRASSCWPAPIIC